MNDLNLLDPEWDEENNDDLKLMDRIRLCGRLAEPFAHRPSECEVFRSDPIKRLIAALST